MPALHSKSRAIIIAMFEPFHVDAPEKVKCANHIFIRDTVHIFICMANLLSWPPNLKLRITNGQQPPIIGLLQAVVSHTHAIHSMQLLDGERSIYFKTFPDF